MNRRYPYQRYIAIASVGIAILTGLAIWLAFALLRPTPPRSVGMAVDPEGSFNAELGKRYREILARDGIDLRLVPTAGAVESSVRLSDPTSGLSIAIIPSGITKQQDSPALLSLGTLFYEPLWPFSHGRRLEKHERLLGLRISIGPEGSASHALSTEFLGRVGIIDQKTATLFDLPQQETAKKLLDGELDAAFLLDAWEAPVVRELLTAKDVNVESFSRPDAFVALYPFLNKLVLPAGVADMIENRPPTDVVLLGPKANLVVRGDLHPAIQYLLLEAATEIHSGPGWFRTAGQFPAPESIDLPLSPHARQFYKTGRPFLQRHLPFWLAVLVQQLLVLMIPAVGVVYPLLRFSPMIFNWLQRRRVYKLYSELKLLEKELASANPHTAHTDLLERLDRLEERASRLSVLMSLNPLQYELRWHISRVRQRAQEPSTP